MDGLSRSGYHFGNTSIVTRNMFAARVFTSNTTPLLWFGHNDHSVLSCSFKREDASGGPFYFGFLVALSH